MMKAREILTLVLLSAAACGPKDVIPASPNHPARPDSPAGATARAAEPDAGMAPAEPEPKDDKAAIATAEQAAYQAARPVFEKYCANCHSSSGKKATKKKLDHFNMDSYPFAGHHAEEIGEEIREVLGLTGEEATMPKNQPGAVKGAELDLIAAWSKAFDAAHKAGLHDHGKGGHDHHGGH